MAVTKGRRYTFRRKKRDKTHTQELAGRLAPPEERQGAGRPAPAGPNGQPAAHADDTIRVSSATIKVPERLGADEREGADIFRLDPIVVAILVGALAFIAFIAWQISLMPAPAR